MNAIFLLFYFLAISEFFSLLLDMGARVPARLG